MAVQPGLCRTRSETLKTGFLTTRLICDHMYTSSLITWQARKQQSAKTTCNKKEKKKIDTKIDWQFWLHSPVKKPRTNKYKCFQLCMRWDCFYDSLPESNSCLFPVQWQKAFLYGKTMILLRLALISCAGVLTRCCSKRKSEETEAKGDGQLP